MVAFGTVVDELKLVWVPVVPAAPGTAVEPVPVPPAVVISAEPLVVVAPLVDGTVLVVVEGKVGPSPKIG